MTLAENVYQVLEERGWLAELPVGEEFHFHLGYLNGNACRADFLIVQDDEDNVSLRIARFYKANAEIARITKESGSFINVSCLLETNIPWVNQWFLKDFFGLTIQADQEGFWKLVGTTIPDGIYLKKGDRLHLNDDGYPYEQDILAAKKMHKKDLLLKKKINALVQKLSVRSEFAKLPWGQRCQSCKSFQIRHVGGLDYTRHLKLHISSGNLTLCLLAKGWKGSRTNNAWIRSNIHALKTNSTMAKHVNLGWMPLLGIRNGTRQYLYQALRGAHNSQWVIF